MTPSEGQSSAQLRAPPARSRPRPQTSAVHAVSFRRQAPPGCDHLVWTGDPRSREVADVQRNRSRACITIGQATAEAEAATIRFAWP